MLVIKKDNISFIKYIKSLIYNITGEYHKNKILTLLFNDKNIKKIIKEIIKKKKK